MNQDYEVHDGVPVNEIGRVDGAQFVIEECVLCGEEHHHGKASPTEVGECAERGAHCTPSKRSYYIKLTEDTDGLDEL